MTHIPNHEMVQAVSSYKTDQAFGVRTLPRALRRGEDLFDLERGDKQPNVAAINAARISQKIARSVVRGEGLDNLLPVRRRPTRQDSASKAGKSRI